MALDPKKIKEPDTDEWWIARLSKDLGNRLPRIHKLEDWMEGEPPLAQPDSPDAESFNKILKLARLNLAELIINAVLYRMQPLAFKTNAPGDDNGDDEASRIWKANNMKVAASKILEWMLTFSVAYAIVGERDPHNRENVQVLITPEHPNQVITEDDPQNPGYAIAALKIYRDDLTNSDVAVLYRENYYRVARHPGNSLLPNRKRKGWEIKSNQWDWDAPEAPEEEILINAQGDEVNPTYTEHPPVHKFANRQDKGEFEKHLPTLERINHTILQRMVIIAFQAFRQRAVKGVPNVDEDGKEVNYDDIFSADPGAVWILPEVAEFWESAQADLTPVLSSVKDDVTQLAVASSTPLFTVVPDAANGSAEGAALQREGLIFKTEACIALADGAFGRAMGSAFEILGDDLRSDALGIEGIWASPRRSSVQEKAIAGVQAKVAGVPWRSVMELFLELTPEQIAKAEAERLDDAFMSSLLGNSSDDISVPGITDPPRTTT